MSKQIFSALRIIALALTLSFGISYVYAWTAPTQRPPSGNVSAPVNVGSITQYKEGILGVGGLIRGYTNAIFDGNVGIGDTSPAEAKLVVRTSGSAEPTLFLTNSDGGTPTGNLLEIQTGVATDSFDFINVQTDKFIVRGDGNVGVGVSNPTQKLDVAGNIKGTGLCIGTDCKTAWPASGGSTPPAGSEFLDTSATAQTKAGWLKAVGGNGGDLASRIGVGNNWWMSENTNGNYAIHRNGVGDKLTMDTSGNVGIGTTNPSVKLDVAGALTTTGVATLNGVYVGQADSMGTITAEPGGTALRLKARAGNQPDLVIATTGNVGIGTTNPGARLGVSSGDASLALFGPNASWGGKLYVGASPNQGVAATAQVISTDGNLHLDPAPSKNMYLGYYQARDMYINPNGGNVGIGKTNPSVKLDVAGQIKSTEGIDVGNAGGAYTYITMRDDESPNGVKYIHANSNVVGFLSGYGGWLSYWDNAGSQYNVGNINANDYYIRASGKWASQLGSGVTKQTTIYQAPAKATLWCWTDGGKQTCTNTCNGQLTTASTCLYAGDCPGYGCGGASAFANTNLGALVQ